MSGGGGGGTQTTVGVEKPWGKISDYLSNDKASNLLDPDRTDLGIYDQVFYNYMPHIWEQMTQLSGEGKDPYSAFYWSGDQIPSDVQDELNVKGGRVAGFTNDQMAAMDMTRGIAQNSGDYIDPAYNNMLNLLNNQGKGMTEIENTWNSLVRPTIEGEYLDPAKNTYLQKYVEAAQRPLVENYLQNTVPTWNQGAVGAGRYGSNAWSSGQAQSQDDLNRALGEVSANIYAPAYEEERTRQMNAAGYAPTVYEMLAKTQQGSMQPFMDTQNQAYKNAGYLSTVGEAEQGMNQNIINAAIQQWTDQLYGPTDWANVIANMFMSGGALGRTNTQSSPYTGPSLSQSLLGTGSSIAGLLNEAGVFN